MKYFFLIFILITTSVQAQIDPPAPSQNDTIPNNIFPLIPGRTFHYTGYLTQLDTEVKVFGTDSTGTYSTSWTIGVDTPLASVFGPLATSIPKSSATLIFDTTKVKNFYLSARFSPLFIYLDTASSDYYYLTNFGLFFRSSRIKDSANASNVRLDSLRFIKIASPKAGIGGEFTSFEENFVSYINPAAPTTITLQITGKWESKTDVAVNGQTFSAYYLIILRVAKIGSIVVSSGVTAKFWFVKGIGPVKMFLAGDSENNGHFRELKETNFLTNIVERKSSEKFPTTFRLDQNYPNPFNPETNIEYHLTNNEFVTLKVFDVLSKEIATLVDGQQPTGSYTTRFDASNLASGLYFYQLKAGRNVETRKMILMK